MEELNKKLENLHRIYLHLNAQKEFFKKNREQSQRKAKFSLKISRSAS